MRRTYIYGPRTRYSIATLGVESTDRRLALIGRADRRLRSAAYGQTAELSSASEGAAAAARREHAPEIFAVCHGKIPVFALPNASILVSGDSLFALQGERYRQKEIQEVLQQIEKISAAFKYYILSSFSCYDLVTLLTQESRARAGSSSHRQLQRCAGDHNLRAVDISRHKVSPHR